MTFTHIIMTRFNLATPGNESTLRNRPGWLEGRFELFETYCLPSVASQTETNFQWIIYFDIDTPPVFKKRVEDLRKIFPFTPYFTDLFTGEGWRISVQETYAPDTELLLTTRLDNDDALASDFVARLHAAVSEHDHALGAYNFANGVVRRGGALYALRHESNAFYSLLEPVSPEMRTAPATQHMKIAEEWPVFQIEGPPTWMQIVHDANVSNKVRGTRIAPGRLDVPDRFVGSAGANIADVPSWRCALENTFAGAFRGLRDTAVRLVRRR